MKELSHYIREGARLRPQGFYSGFSHDGDGDVIKSCAIGAAYEKLTGSIRETYMTNDILGYAFPILSKFTLHPISNEVRNVQSIVAELNDYYKWTREDIAEWVYSIEQEFPDQLADPMERILLRQ